MAGWILRVPPCPPPMTDFDTPRPKLRPHLPDPGPGGGHTAARAGGLLRRRQEDLVRSVMAHLEKPFLEFRPTPFRLVPNDAVSFVGQVGAFHFQWSLPKERPLPEYRGSTSIEQMLLDPLDPGEPRRWTRFAALVVLGLA